MSVDESRKRGMVEFGTLLTHGMQMGMAYVGLRPLLNGDFSQLHGTDVGAASYDVFPLVDAIPWAMVGVVICAGALLWYITKRIPRRVILDAFAPGKLEGADWQDVSQTYSAT